MRVIETIPHSAMNIQILKMNDKYIFRIEAGNMEQIYKIPESEMRSMDEIRKMLQEWSGDMFTGIFFKMKDNLRKWYRDTAE